MVTKNGIKIILSDKEKATNEKTIEYLNEIKNIIPNDFTFRKELIKNTIATLEMIKNYEFIDY